MGRLNVGGGGKRVEMALAGFAIGERCSEQDLFAKGRDGFYYKYLNTDKGLDATERFGTLRIYDSNFNFVREVTEKGYYEIDEAGDIWRMTGDYSSAGKQYYNARIEKLSPDGTSITRVIDLPGRVEYYYSFTIKDNHAYYTKSRILTKMNLDDFGLTTYTIVPEEDGMRAEPVKLFRFNDYILYVSLHISQSTYYAIGAIGHAVLFNTDLEKLSHYAFMKHNVGEDTESSRYVEEMFFNGKDIVLLNRKRFFTGLYEIKRDTSSIANPKRKNLSAKFDILPDFLT